MSVNIEGKVEINHYFNFIFDMSGWWWHLLRSRRQRKKQTALGEEFVFAHVTFNMNIRYPNGNVK